MKRLTEKYQEELIKKFAKEYPKILEDHHEFKYSDGEDYSMVPPNIRNYPQLQGCVECGESYNVSITDERDVCHECGFVYT